MLEHQAFSVTGLPAFNDNYIWVLTPKVGGRQNEVVVVDPGDAIPVIDYCQRHNVLPTQIWLTHHHGDHVGGVADICRWIAAAAPSGDCPPIPRVFGPAVECISAVTAPLCGGETLSMAGLPPVNVLSVPGHTRGHIAYLLPEANGVTPPALFCGDLLFGLGCGRLFEGTAAQMYEALAQVRALPVATRVYCAHEYTLMNLPFALGAAPDNLILQERAECIRKLRQASLPTVPLTLGEELATNPFLRATSVEEFAALRRARDNYKPATSDQ